MEEENSHGHELKLYQKHSVLIPDPKDDDHTNPPPQAYFNLLV